MFILLSGFSNSYLQVSWLRHRNPIPQVLGMNDKIYTKDPRFSVIHDPEDPKLKEVS